MSKLYDDNSYNLTGTFTPEELKTKGLNINGLEPTEGWIKIEKGLVIEYSLKFDEYIVNYDNNKEISIIKNGNITELPSVLENREYSSGEAITNYGGYNWHVLGDDGEKVTLLMDMQQIEEKIDISGCYSTNNNCPLDIDGDNQYSWNESYAQQFLNTIFYDEIKPKIGNQIISTLVCNDTSIKNNVNYSYGGYTKDEIDSLGVTCNSSYESYNVRLITISEYYNITPYENYRTLNLPYNGTINSMNGSSNTGKIADIESINNVTDGTWLYASGNEWLTMTASSTNNWDIPVNPTYFIIYDGSVLFNMGPPTLQIRPVITVKK